MKSDREFLNGIYVKAEKVTSDSVLDFDLQHKKHDPSMKPQGTTRYVKYAGLAASLLLLVSSAMFLDNFTEKNNQISDTPTPRDIRMVNYLEQLIEQASDIIAVEAGSMEGKVGLSITEDFKNSGNDVKILNAIDTNRMGLKEGQSAIVFIKLDSVNTEVLDIFLLDKDNSIYTNQYGEIIELEALYNLEK